MNEEVAGRPHMTFEAYLALEEKSGVRHEFVSGELYAMTGVTSRHQRIVGNIYYALRTRAHGGPCAVYLEFGVRTPNDDGYYPDVLALCEAVSPDDVFTTNPCLIVEVTSRSTSRIDRGEKLRAYRDIPSLRAYLIVDHTRRRVTRHVRTSDGDWQTDETSPAGAIELPCPTVRLSLDDIYEDVEMPLSVAEPEWVDGDSELSEV